MRSWQCSAVRTSEDFSGQPLSGSSPRNGSSAPEPGTYSARKLIDIVDYHLGRQAMLHKREPTSPGEILLEEFVKPLGLTQKRLANHLGCDVKVINRIVNGRTGVTPEMALKLAQPFRRPPSFGSTLRRRRICTARPKHWEPCLCAEQMAHFNFDQARSR